VPAYLLQPSTPPAPPTPPPAPDGEGNDATKNLGILRKKVQTAEQERDQLRAELEKIKATGNVTPETLAALQKERDEALNKIAQLDLSQDPRFKAKYGNAEQNIRNLMKRAVKEYGATDDFVDRVMALSVKDRQKLIQDELPDAAPVLAPHMVRIDELRSQRDTELDRATETRKTLDQQYAIQREKVVAEAREALYSEVIRELDDAGFIPFRIVPGAQEWNDGLVKTTQQLYRDFLSSEDPRMQARALGMGAAAPALLSMYNDLYTRYQKLETEMKTVSGLTANVNGRGTPPAGTPPSVDPTTVTAQSAAKRISQLLRR
jgi:uncharacterized protein (UPF0297 family)